MLVLRVRAFLEGSGITSEVFNISRVRARLVKAMEGLSAPATCWCQRCGCGTGSVSIVTLDADGAVLRAWDSVEHVIEERCGSRVVLVKRGKKSQRCPVNSSLGGGRSVRML